MVPLTCGALSLLAESVWKGFGGARLAEGHRSRGARRDREQPETECQR